MKILLLVVTVFAVLVASSDAIPAKESSDLDDILRKLGVSSSKEIVSAEQIDSNDDDNDDDDDAIAQVMTNALLSTMMEKDEDGDSIMANIMNSNEPSGLSSVEIVQKDLQEC